MSNPYPPCRHGVPPFKLCVECLREPSKPRVVMSIKGQVFPPVQQEQSAVITAMEAMREAAAKVCLDYREQGLANEINALSAAEVLKASNIHAQPERAEDPNVEANRKLLLDRSRVGVKKYGVTLADANLPLGEWMRHLQLELLDAANYVESAIQKLPKEK